MRQLASIVSLTLFIVLFAGMTAGHSVYAAQRDEDQDKNKPKLSAEQEKKLQEYKQYGAEAEKHGWYGTGNYFSITKIVLWVALIWGWFGMIDWMNRDAEFFRNPKRPHWNALNCGLLILFGGFATALNPIPYGFWISYVLNIIAFVVPVWIYSTIRNKPLPPHERVLTPEHLRFFVAICFKKLFKIKFETKQFASYEVGPSIELTASGKNVSERDLTARTLLARNHEGFNDFRFILADAIIKRADAIMLDYGETETQVRFQIDGVWHFNKTLPRDRSDTMSESSKLLCGLNPKERRQKQQGAFIAAFEKKRRFDAVFLCQGIPTGERALIQFQTKKIPFKTYTELGIDEKTEARIKNILDIPQGFVIFSAPPGNGLRSSMDVFLFCSDRFTREFVTVEDEQNRYQEVENVALTVYDSYKGDDLMAVLKDTFFKEPKVFVLRDILNKEVLELCCNEVDNDRLILTTDRAKDTAEALYHFLAKGASPQLFVSKINYVVCQRLARRLCVDCKEAFQPPPKLLQQLGIPQGMIRELYRVRSAPQEGEKREKCQKCEDLGYFGRTVIFEILEINDEIRKAMMTASSLEQLRAAIQKTGHRGFIPSGVMQVARGVISVEELMRVLKPANSETNMKI